MLKFLGYAALLVAVVIAGILAYAATQPDSFRLARSAMIKAPPDKVFPLINDPRAFNSWNPFLKLDPAAKLTYRGPASGKGAGHAWEGNGNVGRGSIEITNSQAPSRIAMRLDMTSPLEAHNLVEFTLVPKGAETQVNWVMSGPSPYISKVMGTVFSMDKMVGSQFEKGLSDLKALAEK